LAGCWVDPKPATQENRYTAIADPGRIALAANIECAGAPRFVIRSKIASTFADFIGGLA